MYIPWRLAQLFVVKRNGASGAAWRTSSATAAFKFFFFYSSSSSPADYKTLSLLISSWSKCALESCTLIFFFFFLTIASSLKHPLLSSLRQKNYSKRQVVQFYMCIICGGCFSLCVKYCVDCVRVSIFTLQLLCIIILYIFVI